MPSSEPRDPEFEFRDGELRIAAGFVRYRLQWRPFARALEKAPQTRGRWQEAWPEFRVLRPADSVAAGDDDAGGVKRHAFDQFRREIPSRYVSVVEPFQSHQWALLKLLREEKRCRELAESNPVLAFCLANSGEFRGTDARTAQQLALRHSYHRQREILAWLGFPGTEAMVRLTRKILPGAANPFLMRRFRFALSEYPESAKLLAHRKEIGLGVLSLVCRSKAFGLVTSKLVAEVAGSEEEQDSTRTADLIEHGLILLNEMYVTRRPRPFRSVAQVRRFHDAAARDHAEFVNDVEAARARYIKRKYAFSKPPVPGTDNIVPIESEIDLKVEGREQRNCVASYAKSIRAGYVYVYKVLQPERATLSITPGSDGCWSCSELRAKRNRQVKPETSEAVDRWLYKHSLSV